jgi:hypothetical protein
MNLDTGFHSISSASFSVSRADSYVTRFAT